MSRIFRILLFICLTVLLPLIVMCDGEGENEKGNTDETIHIFNAIAGERIPMEKVFGMLCVRGKLNGKPCFMAIDTASVGNCIFKNSIERFGIEDSETKKVSGYTAGGSDITQGMTKEYELEIGEGVKIRCNQSLIIPAFPNEEIAGIIGLSLLEVMKAHLNFDGNWLEIGMDIPVRNQP